MQSLESHQLPGLAATWGLISKYITDSRDGDKSLPHCPAMQGIPLKSGLLLSYQYLLLQVSACGAHTLPALLSANATRQKNTCLGFFRTKLHMYNCR